MKRRKDQILKDVYYKSYTYNTTKEFKIYLEKVKEFNIYKKVNEFKYKFSTDLTYIIR